MGRRRIALVGAGMAVVALVGAYAWSQRPRELPPLQTELPEFVEPDSALPRAPANLAFGVAIGAIDLEQLDRHLSGLGVVCDDTGVRAIIQRMRESKAAELAQADDPDAVSGASIIHTRSKREKNPQVRLSCPVASLQAIDPTRAATPGGRALFVFDSPEHPLRHASMRRNHPGGSAAGRVSALRDLQAAIAVQSERFGEPTQMRGVVPEFEEELLDRLEPISVKWRYADLLVEISLHDFGRHVSVDERIEVPWPVESDAPARPRP
jgi:hypothetical protein